MARTVAVLSCVLLLAAAASGSAAAFKHGASKLRQSPLDYINLVNNYYIDTNPVR